MKTLKLISRNKELRKKVLLTLGILLITRILSAIPTPGVNGDYFKAMLDVNASLGFLNVLTGNGLNSLSIMTLSITPYITASIVIQLLGVVFKRIQELQQGMKEDRKKIEYATLALGGVLGFMESLAMAWGFGRKGLLVEFKWYWVLLVALIWTVFSVLASFAGKYVTEKGIGNGVSLILLTNILVSYPSDMVALYERFMHGKKLPVAIVSGVILCVGIILLFAFTYVLQESQKNLRVNYSAKLSQGGRNKQVHTIPLKLCPGGVVPIIFASSIMTTPIIIASVFGKDDNFILNMLNSSYWFNPNHWIYTIGVIIYIALIFGFSYFYTDITLNPMEIADKMKKAGGNISGIRAGQPTADFIRRQMKYMIAIGAGALTIIAMVPIVLGGLFGLSRISFLGTSIIITVGVILESKKVLQTELQQDIYTDNFKKGGLFGAKKN